VRGKREGDWKRVIISTTRKKGRDVIPLKKPYNSKGQGGERRSIPLSKKKRLTRGVEKMQHMILGDHLEGRDD